jgi:hypothetical protein
MINFIYYFGTTCTSAVCKPTTQKLLKGSESFPVSGETAGLYEIPQLMMVYPKRRHLILPRSK